MLLEVRLMVTWRRPQELDWVPGRLDFSGIVTFCLLIHVLAAKVYSCGENVLGYALIESSGYAIPNHHHTQCRQQACTSHWLVVGRVLGCAGLALAISCQMRTGLSPHLSSVNWPLSEACSFKVKVGITRGVKENTQVS